MLADRISSVNEIEEQLIEEQSQLVHEIYLMLCFAREGMSLPFRLTLFSILCVKLSCHELIIAHAVHNVKYKWVL